VLLDNMTDIKVRSVKQVALFVFSGIIHLFGLAKCRPGINTLGTLTHVSKAGSTKTLHYMRL
jgi:hypothetical protein